MTSRVPAAPTRPRRGITTRQPPPSASTDSNNVEQLADELGSSLRISQRASATAPAAKPRTPAPTRRPLPPSTATAKAPTASKSSARPLGTNKATTPTATPAERARTAMEAVNASLQSLLTLRKSGWRASSSSPSSSASPASSRPPSTATVQGRASSSSLASNAAHQATRDKAEADVKACAGGLSLLRELIRDRLISKRPFDVERGAATLIGHLVDMELYRLALVQISLTRASILTWYCDSSSLIPPQALPTKTGVKPPSLVTFVPIVSLPLPPSSFCAPMTLEEAVAPGPARVTTEELCPLVLLLQQYALGCLFRAEMSAEEQGRRAELLAELWRNEAGTPLEWKALLERAMEQPSPESEEKQAAEKKRVDAMMTSVFGTLTKGCVGADTLASPSTLLYLRSRALLAYASTAVLYSSPEKLDAFYEQSRKVLLLYGRQAELQKVGETLINEGVKQVFEELLVVLEAKGAEKQGKAWITLCDVVTHIAKRADDLLMVERVGSLLGADTQTAVTDKPVDPDAQIAQLCARAMSSLSALELFFKTGEDKGVQDLSRRLVSTLPYLSRLRVNQSASRDSHSKVDKIIERLRFVVMRRHKGDKRVEQLMTEAGQARAEKDDTIQMCETLLEALVSYTEGLERGFGTEPFPGRGHIYDGCVEMLLQLAYARLSIDDRSTYAPTLNALERCLPFLYAPTSAVSPSGSSTPSPSRTIDLTAHFSIRSLTGACYNMACQLFNSSKPEAAIKFAQRAAETSQLAVEQWRRRTAGGDGDLDQQLAKLSLDGKVVEGEEKAREKAARVEEAMKDVADKYLTKRWELVALCQHAIGDRKLAHAAYISSILGYSRTSLASLATLSSSSPLPALIVREPNLHKLIQRATKLATFDLLLPWNLVNIRTQLAEAGVDTLSQAVCIEMQVASLEAHLDRKEAQLVVPALLEELLELYDEERYPIRRARTLVRRMQQLCAPSSVAPDLSAAAAAAEIDSLCTQEFLGDDTSLAPFASQYLAFSHIWLAFHAHQAQLPSCSESASTEARQALRILRQALVDDIPPSPSAPLKKSTPQRAAPPKVKSPKAPATTTRRRAAAAATTTAAEKKALAYKTPATRRTLPGSRRVVVDLVTPPSRTALEAEERHVTPKKGDIAALRLDDPEQCYSTLETMANLLGALGYSLLKMAYLKFLRRLSSKCGETSNGHFVATSAQLGHEYVLLGKTSRSGLVFAQADSRIQTLTKAGTPVAPAAQLIYHTLYAEYLAVLGNQDRSAQAYNSAQTIAETLIPDETTGSASTRVVERTLLLQRCALATGVSSVLFQRRGDLNRAITSALQAMRVWSRATSNLSRLSTADAPSAPGANGVFTSTSTDPKAPLPEHPPSARKRRLVTATGPHASLSWQLAENLAGSVLRLATLYSTRGTAKAAEHYADAAIDLAEDFGSARLMARALAVRTEIRLHLNNLDGAEMDLELIGGALGVTNCPEAVEARRLRADLHLQRDLAAEAHRGYLEAQVSLDSFVQDAADGEAAQSPTKATPSKHLSPVQHRSATKGSPMVASPSPTTLRYAVPSDWILPSIQGYLLRVRVSLLRLENKQEESIALLHRLSKLSFTEEDKADESKLLATIQFQDLLKRFSSDPVLGMLPDSVLSMPTLGSPVVAAVKIATPRSAPSLLHCLREVESLLSRAVALSVSRSEPAKLRELSLLTATLRALQVSIGKPSKRSAASVAHVLDLGLAVALRREMLEAIDYKIADSARQDDLHWPLLDSPTASIDSSGESAELQYLIAMRERYRTEAPDPILTETAFSAVLPEQWTTISIHLSPERDCLLLVRHRRGGEPLVFKLPLDRLARREGEDESFTYDIALEELQDIVLANNNTAQNAKNIKDKEARAVWWAERKELDERLKVLTQTIEDDWLGAFKSIFCDARATKPEAFATFKSRVERILKRSIVRAAQDKKASRFKLDDSILECLAALPPASREEDLEDLFYFMMESFQFTGVPVACDETDVDQVVVDIRSALEELHGTTYSAAPDPEQHIFLVLDKAVQSFPWESIPCLRGHSVSRIPSLAFLRDRLDLAAARTEPAYNFTVDASKTFSLLNPGADLPPTQAKFEPWLERMKEQSGWSGIVGRIPSDEEVKVALSNNELFLYFGHGGAEQYVRSQTVRHLPRCATTMLWGCSSGLLKDQGDFDPTGTPYHYVIAGCPALVANLWDVTDKDIDKFAENTLRLVGLDGSPALASSATSTSSTAASPVTLTSAIAQSRDVPMLKYLNGAAPVVYGIPVRFSLPRNS